MVSPGTLRTARLILRPLAMEDAPALHLAFSDEATMRWWSSAPHRDIGETEASVAHNLADPGCDCRVITKGGPALGWVNLRDRRPGVREIGYILAPHAVPGCDCRVITKGGPALGWVNLRDRRPGVREIGYILAPHAVGRGIASEAIRAVIADAFADSGPVTRLRRIFADVDPDNLASIRLLERIGFVREGHLRAEWETHIGIRDTVIFGLLESDCQSIGDEPV